MSQELVVAPGSQASHRVTGLQVGEPSSHMPSLARPLPQGPLYQTYPKAQVATPARHCLFNASHAPRFLIQSFQSP